MAKGENRGLTITFMDGSKMSFVRLPGHAIRNATLTRGDV